MRCGRCRSGQWEHAQAVEFLLCIRLVTVTARGVGLRALERRQRPGSVAASTATRLCAALSWEVNHRYPYKVLPRPEHSLSAGDCVCGRRRGRAAKSRLIDPAPNVPIPRRCTTGERPEAKRAFQEVPSAGAINSSLTSSNRRSCAAINTPGRRSRERAFPHPSRRPRGAHARCVRREP